MNYKEKELIDKKGITKIDCVITRADVEKMTELYDSSMCDVTSQNAAALALKRRLKPHHSVTIYRSGRRSPYICEVDGDRIELSSDLEELFESIDHGLSPIGYHFQAVLPADLLLTSQQNEELVEQHVHSKRLLQST